MVSKMRTLTAGDGIRLFIRTKDITGALTSPSALILTVRRERDTPVIYYLGDLVKVADGIYYCDLTLDRGGKWYFHVSATGQVLAATQTFLDVAPDLTEL